MFNRINPLAFSLLFATLSGCGGMALGTDPESGTGTPTDETTTNTPPQIELLGALMVEVDLNSQYVEPGVTATDLEDGDLSHKVLSDAGSVDTSKEGIYHVTYQVKDSRNASAKSKVRTVVVVSEDVVAPVPPITVEPEPVEPTPVEPTPVEPTPVEPTPSPEVDPVIETPDTTDPVSTSVPVVRYFKLIGYTADRKIVDIQALESGNVVDLAKLPTNLVNVMAVSADQTKTGSVHFTLSGPVDIDRYENNAIYTMAEEPANLDILAGGLVAGEYTLTATPYELADMNGAKGASTAVSFSVVDGSGSQPTASTTPGISTIEFVTVTADTDQYVPVTTLTNGASVDLSDVSTGLANIIAHSENAEKTGSVKFTLNGPAFIERVEATAEYTMANAADGHLDVSLTADELPVGSYELTVTAYSEPDASGIPSASKQVQFEIVRSEKAPAPAPAPAPTLVVAEDDTFWITPGAENSFSVGANDKPANAGAKFMVVDYPSNGEVMMDQDGVFFYSPNQGFSGLDTFTYKIAADGKSDQAKVSINVAASTATGVGFTTFEPSKDSRLIYVSSSAGNDSNDCYSPAKPCKSLGAALSKTRDGMPDHVYLKRGDVWRNQDINKLKSGRSASEPAVVAFYGSAGDRPKLEHDQNLVHVFKQDMVIKNVQIIGLHFDAYKLDTKNSAFTGASSDHANLVFLMDNENVLLEDNVFNHIEIIVQHFNGMRPKNFTLRRNIWTGSYYNKSSFDRNSRPSNVYAAGVDGLTIEENVFDYGGWHPEVAGAGANMFNHNLYLQAGSRNVFVRGNIITRASSHGLQARSGGVVENNFFGRNAVGLLVGYDLEPLPTGVKAHAINNVITEGHSMMKGKSPCSGTNLCTSALWGLHFVINGAADYQAHGNIVHSVDANDTLWKQFYSGLVTKAFQGIENSVVKASNNVQSSWGSNVLNNVVKLSTPAPKLGDYYDFLQGQGVVSGAHAGSDSFDKFMTAVKSRGLQQWDERLSAKGINNYVRAAVK